MEKRIPTPFRSLSVAIVGAGLIGRSWAIVFARAGHLVTIWDSDLAAVRSARAAIEDALGELHRFGLLSGAPDAVLKRIRPASTLDEAVTGADYVQESTAERVDVKQLVFAQMDAIAAPECILAS